MVAAYMFYVLNIDNASLFESSRHNFKSILAESFVVFDAFKLLLHHALPCVIEASKLTKDSGESRCNLWVETVNL